MNISPTDCAEPRLPASLDGDRISGEAASSFPEAETPTAPAYVTTDAELLEAESKARVCEQFASMRAAGLSLRQAARELGKSPSWFSGSESPFALWQRDGVAGLLARRSESGAKAVVLTDLPDWFIPACQFFYRRTNRTAEAGSVPEAIRRAISMPSGCPAHLVNQMADALGIEAKPTRSAFAVQKVELPTFPAELREQILARERDGKDLLPERLMRQIPASTPIIRAIRNPRDAWLRYIENPGSIMLTVDEDGVERFLEPGEWWTIDDGTINFVCTVALARPGDPCFDRFGVIAGRFQFLLVVDHRSYCVTGFSYTARPRSSYRAEDLNATMHTAFAEHGRPRVMVLEKGISAARSVSDALGQLGIQILRANSPHQKVVENVFNKLWTRLSLQRGQVGRYRGEEEETNRLLDGCRTGATDPRRHFLPLAEVLRALREAIAEHNSQVISGRYGRWVPAEYFAAHAKKHLRPIDASNAWVFSPVVAAGSDNRGLKVRSMCIKTSVPLLPGFSQSFAFTAPQLAEWFGARVKLYFNPLAPDCMAKVVLAEPWRGQKAGAVLCDALQIDRQARYTRRLLEYGADPDIGKLAARQNALALSRHAQAIRPDRIEVAPVVETRDGREVTTIGAAAIRTAEPVADPNIITLDRSDKIAELAEFERRNAALFQ